MTKQVAVGDRFGQRHRLTIGCLNPYLGQFRKGIRHGIVQFEFARSCRIIAATLVITVIDQIGNTVSSLIARS